MISARISILIPGKKFPLIYSLTPAAGEGGLGRGCENLSLSWVVGCVPQFLCLYPSLSGFLCQRSASFDL